MTFDFTVSESPRYTIAMVIKELEADNQISFPSDEDRADFEDDCTSGVCYKTLNYQDYTPDYEAEVLDLAKLYEYVI